MEKYTPIINIDNFDNNKVIIDNSKFNLIKYNLNEVYHNINLRILIKDCNIILYQKKFILTNNIKVINLYEIFLSKTNNKNNIKHKNIKLYFNKNISKAYLNPSKKSGKNKTLVKNYEDFINIFSEYYPYSNSFNNKLLVTADIIIQPSYNKETNACNFIIYDADISYENYNKNIINNKLIRDNINLTPIINL